MKEATTNMEQFSNFDIIWEFQRRLIDVYKNEDLTSINGLNGNSIIEGENVTISFSNAIFKGEKIYETSADNLKFDYNKLNSDLRLISDEILHFTGLTCLYSYHLSNPINNSFHYENGFTVYSNLQDLPDNRFFMYATCAYEKLYNYWDRIGDLIASYFPDLINPKNVYFSKIDKFVPLNLHNEIGINWLIEFKNSNFSELNELRIGIVHYENLQTEFSSTHSKYVNNKTQLEILISNRSQIIIELKKHISYTMQGFVEVIRFMEFLNENILTEEVILEKRNSVFNENETYKNKPK